ncbi:MAG: glycosyltransferase [Deltaproteobacteria bacterium]|nr:glycosyltransferase [Deltaproteobacteria bacterium]
MRICFLIRRLDRGGAERQLLSLVKGLPKDRFNITVMEFYDGGGLVPELENVPGVKRVCLKKGNRWHTLGFFRTFLREMRAADPDIIHGYLYVANILAVVAKFFLKRKPAIVMGFRSSNTHLEHYDWMASCCALLERKLSRFSDLLIANSNAGAEYCKAVGYSPKRIAVVSNGIDIEQFQPNATVRAETRRRWGVPDQSPLIGIVGRFDRKKNHAVFLRAAAVLAQEFPEARFVGVGGGGRGNYPEEMRQLSRDLGLSEKMVWAGETQDMNAVYNALDLNTLCSNAAEGFPNVLAEAMACGVPCVATDTGDARHILGPTGIIVPESKVELLVTAWKTLLKQDPLPLRQQTRQRIVENFSIQKLAENTEHELRDLSWA